MPPNRSRSKQDSIKEENRIELAIQAVQNKKISSIAAVARIYNIPRSTLRDRVAGQYSLATTSAHGHKMSQLDEDTLNQWIYLWMIVAFIKKPIAYYSGLYTLFYSVG